MRTAPIDACRQMATLSNCFGDGLENVCIMETDASMESTGCKRLREGTLPIVVTPGPEKPPKHPRDDPEPSTAARLRQVELPAAPFAFMRPSAEWTRIELKGQYVPQLSGAFAPVRNGAMLAVSAGCARAKSTRFRDYMRDVRAQMPGARILLISANILYAGNLSHELRCEFPGEAVGYYKETKGRDMSRSQELAACSIVVCSLESLFLVHEQRFEMMLIDEVHTIGGLVGGATMQSFDHAYLLRRICTETPRVVACDADLLYRQHDTEPEPAAVDFINFLSAGRPVICASMSDPGPEHLERNVRLFYNCKKAAVNKTAWLDELRHAADAWHANHEHRIAICVGSKKQLAEVSKLLEECKVPWKPYSGDTSQIAKEALKDPDPEWRPFGAIVFTTSLSIGVNPKTIRFARSFISTSRSGCNPLTQAQAIMRFGRSEDAQLLNPTIDVLLDCRPSSYQLALEGAKREAASRRPTYDEELGVLRKRQNTRSTLHAHIVATVGGHSPDVRPPADVSDQLLRLMAHGRLEQALKQRDHEALFRGVCTHHRWDIVDYTASPAPDVDVDCLSDLETNGDDAFAVLTDPADKLEWVLQYVAERGEAGFFDEYCYGLAHRDERVNLKSARMLYLVEAYWLLLPFGSLEPFDLEPSGGDFHRLVGVSRDADSATIKAACGVWEGLIARCSADEAQRAQLVAQLTSACVEAVELAMHGRADQESGVGSISMPEELEVACRRYRACADLHELSKPGVRRGLELNAHSRCMGISEQHCLDRDRALCDDREKHPMLSLPLGARMRAADQCARLLGVEKMTHDCTLPQRVVDVANREKNGEGDERDASLLSCLRYEADAFGDKGGGSLVELLKTIATACGMLPCLPTRKLGPRGDRKGVITSIGFHRRLPHLVDRWLVHSERLGKKVDVRDWASQHAAMDEEAQQELSNADMALDDAMPDDAEPTVRQGGQGLAVSDPTTQRLEKIDGVALDAEIKRLAAKKRLTKREARWSKWLETTNSRAFPCVESDSPPPAERHVLVTYHKRRVIGRRVASHPSLQACPSLLRLQLVHRFYHDVDVVNCHPTLFLQVAMHMSVAPDVLAILSEYVDRRDDVLRRIADFYGVVPSACKFAVLRVLNGGSIMAWVRDAEVSRNHHEESPDLLDLVTVAEEVRGAFFRMPQFEQYVSTLLGTITGERTVALAAAQARLAVACKPEDKRVATKSVSSARAKATVSAVRRTVFSLCVFQLEDTILDVIDTTLRGLGWVVASLQFDGCHVEHRADGNLEAAMRRAEVAVRVKLGYSISLKEKDLYQAGKGHTEMWEENDALMENEGYE